MHNPRSGQQAELNLICSPAEIVHDAWLLNRALRQCPPDTTRHEFVLRLRRSFREWGSLTTAMREALRR
jgi:hypothetical protein